MPSGFESNAYWLVGAMFDDQDQTKKFIQEGIWEIRNPTDNELALIKSMQPGDPIAIKSTYIRKHGLPFDSRGNTVSVMAIKAIGRIRDISKDGVTISVEWNQLDNLREWYFYTYRATIWRVAPGDWKADGLIRFTFEGQDQELARFRNDPFWRGRFGDSPLDKDRFVWTRFFESIADKLLTFRNRRGELISGIHAIAQKFDCMSILNDQYEKNVPGGPLKDICPFTAMGIFNRGITDANRKAIASELANLLGVNEPVPDSFEGIPTLNNQRTWFFGYSYKRQPDDIDTLWEVFARAITYADSDDPDSRSKFAVAYDNAAERYGVGWNLTMGLYWIRPWSYPTLDAQSQRYISTKLNIQIGMNGPKGRSSARDYLELQDTLKIRFQEEAFSIHSFPELSLASWKYRPQKTEDEDVLNWKKSIISKIEQLCSDINANEFTRKEFLDRFQPELSQEFPNNNTIEATINRQFQILRDDDLLEFVSRGFYRWLGSIEFIDPIVDIIAPIETYSIENILSDGCFIAREHIEKILERLRTKKNLILQGPPGTGKTWLAKRLAFALIGQRDESKVRAVQFHPNLSYEDFIRGWRPVGDGKLSLVDGPFMEMINAAGKNPACIHVVVIEEINRGNPAQILGEMLTLLEVDKRTPNEALELSYKRSNEERVFIPGNLYVIGTMNIADRSLALVDLALRRRFAFIDLEPTLGTPWQTWVHNKCEMDLETLNEIEKRILSLNNDISSDTALGPQFRIGHSYVTPPFGIPIPDGREWFRQVVATEIGPLLDEYWFDSLEKSRKARERLLDGF
jgi:5-methylcytosine-specific restriction protein B